jgi:hypothetical protein
MPTCEEVERYIQQWNSLDSYVNQEHALDKLFFRLCRRNDNIEDILIKCSALNDFYSTNIFDVHSVARHILSLNIDSGLENGDLSLVEKIAKVKVGEKKKEYYFYSFASKYCSHHQPLKYAIYDSYVEKVLIYFRKRDHFCDFKDSNLKTYREYLRIIQTFQSFYGLDKYNLKQIDQYLWQLGREHYSKYPSSTRPATD